MKKRFPGEERRDVFVYHGWMKTYYCPAVYMRFGGYEWRRPDGLLESSVGDVVVLFEKTVGPAAKVQPAWLVLPCHSISNCLKNFQACPNKCKTRPRPTTVDADVDSNLNFKNLEGRSNQLIQHVQRTGRPTQKEQITSYLRFASCA